jgi:hypothetical protein
VLSFTKIQRHKDRETLVKMIIRISYGEKERKELSVVDEKKKIKREQNKSRDRAPERQR